MSYSTEKKRASYSASPKTTRTGTKTIQDPCPEVKWNA